MQGKTWVDLTHTGHNHATIKQLVKLPAFARMLAGLKSIILEHAQCDRTFVIVLVCTSGCHRSVAVSEILDWVLTREGFEVLPVRHLSKGSWHRRTLCSTSSECTTKAKELTFMKVLRQWCEIERAAMVAEIR